MHTGTAGHCVYIYIYTQLTYTGYTMRSRERQVDVQRLDGIL